MLIHKSMISRKALASGYCDDDNRRLTPNGAHFEPQRASVRVERLINTYQSDPHASALRLRIYKVSANWLTPNGAHFGSVTARAVR